MNRFSLYIFLFIFAFFTGCTEVDYTEFSLNKSSRKILVDASHDGGVWWFPQTGTFSSKLDHQGKALADLLRSQGFIVDELPRGVLITDSILNKYDKVIRAGSHEVFQPSEILAYTRFLNRASSLFLISEFLTGGERDELAEAIGIIFGGNHVGNVDLYSSHLITNGATPFFFNAGSIVTNTATNSNIIPLGWLSGNNNLPVLGILNHSTAKIIFLGDMNGIEQVPQPLTNNFIAWLFE